MSLRFNPNRLTLCLAITGGLSLLLPLPPAQAGYNQYLNPFGSYAPTPRDYQECAQKVMAAKVDGTQAAQACGAALNPQYLGRCVADITTKTSTPGLNALDACRRVRQPQALARCVVSISAAPNNKTPNTLILDDCRRSLQPDTFASCVTGLSSQAGLPVAKAMSSCIDLPTDLTPTTYVSPTPAGS